MAVSAFDLFSIGIGPSSSHTVGPMRAARRFVERAGRRPAASTGPSGSRPSCSARSAPPDTATAATRRCSGAWRARTRRPSTPASVPFRIAEIAESARIRLNGTHQIGIHLDNDVILHRRLRLPYHPNGMTFTAYDSADELLRESHLLLDRRRLHRGGRRGRATRSLVPDPTPVPYDFRTGDELLAHCAATGLRISDVMLANECARRPEAEVRAGLLRIWAVMAECVRNGCGTVGVLPGGLKVRRRASALYSPAEHQRGDRTRSRCAS